MNFRENFSSTSFIPPYNSQFHPVQKKLLKYFKLPNSTYTFATKFPANFTLNSLCPPLTVEPQDHDKSLVQSSWILQDQKQNKFLAQKTMLDTSAYFIMVEHENYIEITPIQAWLNLRPCKFETFSSVQTTDLIEHKRRTALINEERRNAHILSRTNTRSTTAKDQPLLTKQHFSDNITTDVYAEDGGLLIQHKRKLRHALKARKHKYLKEDEGVIDSALNLCELKRAEVDWDWDDDGKASDDEEDIDDKIDEVILHDYQKSEYLEPDGQEEEILTKLGQKVNSALETQKEQDAADELAQFSDDEDQPTTTSTALTNTQSNTATEDVSNSTTTFKLKKSKAEDDIKSPEALKQKIIRLLSLQGGRMSTREFVERFNITDKLSDHFKIIRKVLNEICEVYTETSNGVTVRLIELQRQFRT